MWCEIQCLPEYQQLKNQRNHYMGCKFNSRDITSEGIENVNSNRSLDFWYCQRSVTKQYLWISLKSSSESSHWTPSWNLQVRSWVFECLSFLLDPVCRLLLMLFLICAHNILYICECECVLIRTLYNQSNIKPLCSLISDKSFFLLLLQYDIIEIEVRK